MLLLREASAAALRRAYAGASVTDRGTQHAQLCDLQEPETASDPSYARLRKRQRAAGAFRPIATTSNLIGLQLAVSDCDIHRLGPGVWPGAISGPVPSACLYLYWPGPGGPGPAKPRRAQPRRALKNQARRA